MTSRMELIKNSTDSQYPWVGEPNYACGWYNGRRWIIMRGPVGSYCGYVEFKPTQVEYKNNRYLKDEAMDVTYDNINIDCHGGLTFSGTRPFVEWNTEVSPYQPTMEEIYCIGFDCAHYQDLTVIDFIEKELFHDPIKSIYRSFEYVKEQCISICKQLDEMEGK